MKDFLLKLCLRLLWSVGFVVAAIVALFSANGYQLEVSESSSVPAVMKTSIIDIEVPAVEAQVYMDDVLVSDNLPVVLKHVQPGEHTLRVEKPGFVSWGRTIRVHEDLVAMVRDVVLVPENLGRFVRDAVTVEVFEQEVQRGEVVVDERRNYRFFLLEGMLAGSSLDGNNLRLYERGLGSFEELYYVSDVRGGLLLARGAEHESLLYGFGFMPGEDLFLVASQIEGDPFVNARYGLYLTTHHNLFVYDLIQDVRMFVRQLDEGDELLGWYDEEHFLLRKGGDLWMVDIYDAYEVRLLSAFEADEVYVDEEGAILYMEDGVEKQLSWL